jgi:hypothetical protein
MWRISLIVLLLFGAAGPAAAQKLGPGNPSCYQIHNMLPFGILTHIILPSKARSVARLNSGETQRHCLEGELFPDGQVNFRVVSGLGPPLFSCMTTIDRTIVVTGQKKPSGGYEYDATCRK